MDNDEKIVSAEETLAETAPVVELTEEQKAKKAYEEEMKKKIEACQKEIEESLKKHGLELRVLNQILVVPPQPKQ